MEAARAGKVPISKGAGLVQQVDHVALQRNKPHRTPPALPGRAGEIILGYLFILPPPDCVNGAVVLIQARSSGIVGAKEMSRPAFFESVGLLP